MSIEVHFTSMLFSYYLLSRAPAEKEKPPDLLSNQLVV